MKQRTLFSVNKAQGFELGGIQFSRVENTEKFIDWWIKWQENFEEDYYELCEAVFFSYWNKGQIELYVNEDTKHGYIPIAKKFKNAPRFFILNPICENSILTKICAALKPMTSHDIRVYSITEDLEDKRSEIGKVYKQGYDFITDTKILTELKGKEFKKIRKAVNKFEREYKPKIEILGPENKDEVLELIDRWLKTQGQTYFRVTVGRDIRLVEEYSKNEDEYNTGIVIRVGGKVVGFRFICINKKDLKYATAVTMKSDLEYEGINYYMVVACAKMLYAKGVMRLNLSGSYSPGTKVFKEKFKPIKRLNWYELKI